MKVGKLQALKKSVTNKSPEILIALGIISMVTATVMAIKETPKAADAIEELKEEAENNDEEVTTVEIVKATWKYYIPSVVATGLGIASILESHSIMKKRLAVFVTAYSSLDTAYNLYKKKALDVLGEKKEKEITDAVAKERIETNPPTDNIFITGNGNTLCYDSYSDRYFRSDIEIIRRAFNNMNRQMLDECYVSLNELYYEMDLPGVGNGHEYGWRVDEGLIDPSFSSQIAKTGEPCIVVDFVVKPAYDYSRSMF